MPSYRDDKRELLTLPERGSELVRRESGRTHPVAGARDTRGEKPNAVARLYPP